MDYYKKQKVKDWFSKNWKPLVATSSLVLVALVAMLIGFHMSGWDIMAWLKSKYAEIFFICVVLGVVGLIVVIYIFYLLKNHIRKRDE